MLGHVKTRSTTIMHHTRAQVDFIESMTKERLRYETICAEQGEMLRSDPPKFEAAMAQARKSPLIAKRGQLWEPKDYDVDEYLAFCDDICLMVPRDFNELSL